MRICKRSTPDPLLQAFLDTYRLNLLTTPRASSSVGDLYVRANGRTSSPGALTHFLTPGFEIEGVNRDEVMAAVTGTITNAISFSIGLSLLDGFFTAVGAVGLIDDVKAAYSNARAHSLRFSFADARRDSVDAGYIGRKLIRQRFNGEHALVNPGNRYYLVTGVAKSRSISVTAATRSDQSVELGAEVIKSVEADGKISISKEREGTYTYSGPEPLVFGVELFALKYDTRTDKMKMLMPDGAIKVLGKEKPDRPLFEPAFVETEDDDAFFELD